MKSISLKSLKRPLLWGLMLGALAPAVAAAATPTQSFYIYGQAQLFNGPVRFATPFIGTMNVDPNFKDQSFGHVGRVISIAVRFPFLWGVPSFNQIVTQGPEISGITPLKYDVTLLNAKGQQVQFQFTTLQSPLSYPGLGTPAGSLVNFSGGSFMQGSSSGPIDLGYGYGPMFLQNFRGNITSRR
ncbi:MAG: hypothetical protein ABI128_06535 [Rhodanobacter sp.]